MNKKYLFLSLLFFFLVTAPIKAQNCDVAVGGIATASNYHYPYLPANAFDKNDTTSWRDEFTYAWASIGFATLAYYLPIAKVVNRYSITTTDNPFYHPTSWYFSGSNDNVNWTPLGIYSNQNLNSNTTYFYNVNNTLAFKYYRLSFNLSYSSSYNSCTLPPFVFCTPYYRFTIGLAEFRLYEADYVPPTITYCPDNQTLVANANCGAVLPDYRSLVTVSDNCDTTPTITQSPSPGAYVQDGVQVSFEVKDDSGNINSSCSFMVNIDDQTDPVINCPADIQVYSAPGQCGAQVNYSLSYSDNCGVVYVLSNGPGLTGGFFPVGTTLVTYTAFDANGNIDTCSFNVTVIDNEPPNLECVNSYNVNLEADGTIDLLEGISQQATYLQTLLFTTFEDNCGVDLGFVGNNHPANLKFDCDDLGDNFVQFSARDVNGNISYCTVNIIVSDPLSACNQPPVAVCQNIQVSVDSNCQTTITPGHINNGSYDPDGDAITLSLDTSGPFGLGVHTVELTVSDGQSLDKCTAIITVVDTTPPSISCPSDVKFSCAMGDAGQAVASDNCDANPNISSSDETFLDGCGLGTITRTWRAEDSAGNTSSCVQVITIYDDEAPEIVCPSDVRFSCAMGDAGQASATDNCDPNPSISSSDSTDLDGCGFGTIRRTWTAVDCAGNTSSCVQVITIYDDEAPTILCPGDVVVNSDSGSCYAKLSFSSSSTDNCDNDPKITATINGSMVTWPYDFEIGTTNVIWKAEDCAGNYATCVQSVTVEKITTTTTVTVTPGTQQYSDLVTFEATVTPYNCTGAGDIGGKVMFKVGTQDIGGALIVNGVATLADVPLLEPSPFGTAPTGQMAPGNHTVTAVFLGTDSDYIITDPTTNLLITQEDANVDYTGQSLQATPNASSSIATVVLSANIQDIDDSYRGDIRNATVTFVDRDNGDAPISPAIPVANLVIPGDNTLGTVSYDWVVDIGNFDALSFTVGIVVSGYYTRDNSYDDTVITVYKPVGDFITGGGTIVPQNSAGQYASTPGLKTNFGFNVGYNRKGNKLKGHLNVIFRRLETDGIIHVYQIKSNAIQSLGVDVTDPLANFATFITKSNLTDITDPLNVISLGGNLLLKVDMTDRGEPGTDDSISMSLTDGGTLLFSSNWTGITTTEMQLNRGNLLVHSGYSVGKTVEPASDLGQFELKSWPNPSKDVFNLKLISENTSDQMEIKVFDVNGRLVHQQKGSANKEYQQGANFEAGMYYIKVTQGEKSDQVRMIKF